MTSPMLQPALQFHNEGLCVLPIRPRDKAPAVEILGGTWEQYHTRCSTEEEIKHWWGNGYNKDWNIGISHGSVSGGYVTLDIDKDNGMADLLMDAHYNLCTGRIEQSGSGEGYHIPLRVDQLPDFGFDSTQKRARGNKTWKTAHGHLNIRANFCQTLTPPSIHPTGNPYRYIQAGPITHTANLDSLIEWLNELAPPAIKSLPQTNKPVNNNSSDDLLASVESYWQTSLKVFDHFSMAGNVQQERNGEFRLLGNGGLLLTEDCSRWYSFSDETGGYIFEAWGYCRFGSSYDNRKQFRQVLLEMADAAGIDTIRYQKREQGFTVPDSDTLIVVMGEGKAELLNSYGLRAIGLPGNSFKRQWAKLFKKINTVYIALDPGRERQAELIASELKAHGVSSLACLLPCPIDEMITRYNGTIDELRLFLAQGKKV